MFKIFLFGVPGGFEIYPDAERVRLAYYQQFYNSTAIDDYRLMIRYSNTSTLYTFLNYGLISGINRQGSLWGMSVIVEGQYFSKPRRLLNLFQSAFSKLVDNGRLFRQDNGVTRYQISSFTGHTHFLQNVIEVIGKEFEGSLKQDLLFLRQTPAPLNPFKTILISANSTDEIINESFFKYHSIAISPSVAENNTEEINSEVDFEKFFTLSERIVHIRKDQSLLQSEIQNLQSIFSGMQLQPAGQSTSSIKSEWLQINAQLQKNGEALQKINQTKTPEDKNGLAIAAKKDIELLQNVYQRQLKIIQNLKELINARDSVSGKLEEDSSYSKKRISKKVIGISLGVLAALLLILFLLRPRDTGLDNYRKEIQNGDEQIALNNIPEAARHYENALAAKPGDQVAMDKLKYAKLKVNDLNDQILSQKTQLPVSDELYKIAMKKGDSNYLGVGRAKNLAKAKRRYLEALDIKPNDVDALDRLSKVEEEIERTSVRRSVSPKLKQNKSSNTRIIIKE